MANLNTQTSVVDYLKSTGKDASFGSRSTLAKQYGITNYTGTAQQNTQLLGFLQKPAAPAANPWGSLSGYEKQKNSALISGIRVDGSRYDFSKWEDYLASGGKADLSNVRIIGDAPVNNPADANNAINQNQPFDQASQGKDVAVKEDQSFVDFFNNNFSTVASRLTGTAEKPAPINFEAKMNEYRNTYKVAELETQANDLQKQELEMEAAIREMRALEGNKRVATDVIEGRTSERERTMIEALDTVKRNRNFLVNELNTKYNIINTMMNLADKTYDNAVKDYETQFSQNLNVLNAVKGMYDTMRTEKDRSEDNARANLQIIVNQLSSGAMDFSKLSAAEKANITKLEVQAGFPVGFTKTIQDKNPKSDIVSTTTRVTDGGQKYVDVVLRDKETGKIYVQSQYLGKDKTSDGDTNVSEWEAIAAENQQVESALNAAMGKDGKVSPEDWRKIRRMYPFDKEDFDSQFRGYVNPAHPQDYEGYEEYESGFYKP